MKMSNPGEKTYKKKNYFTIKKGTQVFRILPAIGDAADRGIWYKYHEVHFGFRGTTGGMKVFQTPEVRNSKTRMIEVSDAAKERNAKIRAKLKELKEKISVSPDDVTLQEQFSKVQELADKFNSEKRYYYNAIDLDGNVGLLKLKIKERAALEAARSILEKEEGVDPVKINGAFLVFTKSGNGQQESTVQVSGHYLTEKLNGKTARVLNTHTVEESIFPKLESDAFDLLNLFVRPTAEEVKMMVEGGPEMIDEVFSRYKRLNNGLSKKTSNPDTSVDLEEEMAAEMIAQEDEDEGEIVGNLKETAPSSVGTTEQDYDSFLAEMGITK
jgi:hypothetical protein